MKEAEMLSEHVVAHRVGLTLAAVAAGLVLFLTGVAVGSAGDGPRAQEADVAPLPDWFLPIWDAYDRNPAITPQFDFAALYSGELDAARRSRP